MSSASFSDLSVDIPESIEYNKCCVGDQRGSLICTCKTKHGARLVKIVKWDGINKSEYDAIAEAKQFINDNSRF